MKKKFFLFMGLFLASLFSLSAQVNPDGSFSSGIEVKVPGGVRNMAPQLELQYTSTTANGMVGTGWTLSGLSFITRFDNGGGIEYDGEDDYIHSDLGTMVSQGPGLYHTKRESFTRIQAMGSAGDGPACFIATDRSGVKFYYGYSSDSRIEAVGKAGSIRVWALHKVVDLYGNYYTVNYYEDRANGDYYPTKITYTQGPGLNRFRTIEFGYEARSDHWKVFDQNVPVRSNYRLKSIYVKTDGNLIRRYKLSYEYGPLTQISRLISVTEYGKDNKSAMPEISVRWQEGGSGFIPSGEFNLTPTGGKGIEHWNIDAGDVNGDGLSDLLRMEDDTTGTARVMFADGSGRYTGGPGIVLTRTGGKGIKHRNLPVGDLNGDGKADLIRLMAENNDTTGEARALLSNGDGTFSEGPVFTLTRTGTDALNKWNLVLGDVNGDARTDLLRMINDSTGESEVLFSNGDGTFSPGPAFNLTPTGGGGISKWNVPGGDINGDGKSDILRTVSDSNGLSEVLLSNGDGTFAPGPRFTLTGTGGSGISRWNLIAGDVNGDGRSDILRTVDDGNGKSQILFSRGDGSFLYGPYFYLSGTGGQGISRWNLPAGDINGDGKTDIIRTIADGSGQTQILYSRGNGYFTYSDYITLTPTAGVGITRWNLIVGDINGDAKTDILRIKNDADGTSEILTSNPVNANYVKEIKNRSGGITRISYQPAVTFPGAITPGEEGPGIPNTAPRLMVAQLTTDNGRGLQITRNYNYYNGRIRTGSIDKREDLSFAWVEEKNNATGESSRTYYRQDYPFNGHPARVLNYAGNGQLMGEKVMEYDQTDPSQNTVLVRLQKEENRIYNLGTLLYTRTTLNTYDPYGNLLTQEKQATGQPSSIMSNSYINDTDNWILGRLAAMEIRSGTELLRKEAFEYTGNFLTGKITWQTETLSHKTLLDYDGNGNMISTTDPLGRITRMNYDPVYHVYVTAMTNPKNQTLHYTYDIYGNMVEKKDRSGLKTSYQWDQFHRKTWETRPDGSFTATAYVNQGDPNNQYIQNTIKLDSRTVMERTFFDGQEFAYKKEKSSDRGMVTQLFEKDPAGREYRNSQPFYPGEEILWTTNEFDTASRMIKVTLPDGSEINFAYENDSVIITDGNGHSTTKTYNAMGKIARIEDAGGGFTTYTYDALERRTSIIQADQSETSLTYDLEGNKLSIRETVTGLTTYTYNAAGKPVTITDASGRQVQYEYDELDRVTLKDLPGDEVDVVYVYDEAGVANGTGMLTSRTDAAGLWRFGYDTRGLLTFKSLTMEGSTYIHQYSYDSGGRITGILYPQGSSTEYTYTPGGNLESLSFDGSLIASWEDYNALGKPGRMIYGNGLETGYTYGEMGELNHITTSKEDNIFQDLSYTFDNSGQITAITDNRFNKFMGNINTDETQFFVYDEMDRLIEAAGVYGDYDYAYDEVGNITEKEGMTFSYTDQRLTGGDITAGYDILGNMTSRTAGGMEWTYGYTSDNRLKEVYADGKLRTVITYADGGRRLKKQSFGPERQDWVTTCYVEEGYEVQKNSDGMERHTINLYGNGNILFSRTFDGALFASGTREMENQKLIAGIYGGNTSGFLKKNFHLISAYLSHPKAASIAQGVILSLAVLTLLIFFGVSLAGERRGLRLLLFRRVAMLVVIIAFLFQGTPFLFASLTAPEGGVAPLGSFYYTHNHIGSSTVITDAAGQEVTRMIYKPYGEIDDAHSTGTDSVTKKFTGQELDRETGLYYFKGRYYDPATGRFITPDTYVDDPEEVQTLNRYAYSKNNPVNYIDPTGHFFKSLFKAVKKLFKAVVKVVKAIVKTVVKIVKAVVNVAAGVVTFIWHNPITRSALMAMAFTAAVILSGGGALTMGPLVIAGLKAAAVTAIMQSPVGQKMTMMLARGLEKLGLSSKSAGILSSLLVTTGVSAAVNFTVARIGGVSVKEISAAEAKARLNEYTVAGKKLSGSMDKAVTGVGTQFNQMVEDAADGARFYEVWQNGNMAGMFAEKPLDFATMLGSFAPQHTAAWTPVANLGSSLEMLSSKFGAQYAVLGVCHNSANHLLMQATGGFYSNQIIGWHNTVQYAFTSTVYQNHPWVLGYDY